MYFDNISSYVDGGGMQKKYCEDERFPNNLLKMLKNASIDGQHILSSIQICHHCIKKNMGILVAHTSTLHAK
jgi:hypothetical protein